MSTFGLAHGTEGATLLQNSPPMQARRLSPVRRLAGTGMVLRATLVALAYVVVTGGLLAGLLKEFRDGEISASRRELGAFAQLAAGHTFEVALALEQSLKLAEMTLTVAAGSSAADQDSIGPMLREVAKNARSLKDVLVLDARGRVIFQADGSADIGLDWSERPFFLRTQESPIVQFAFGAPFQSKSAGAADEWLIPVTHAWRKSNGEFAGAIVGLMDPEFFAKAWRFDSEIAGLSITLGNADGTLIARRPFVDTMITTPVIDNATRQQILAGQTADTLIVSYPENDQSELLAYRRVAAYPDLLIFVSQPLKIVLTAWQRIAWIASSAWLAASLALGGLGVWLAREMKARGALETRYHALFNSIPHAVIVSDHETGRIVAFNDAAVEQYGWSADAEDLGLPVEFASLEARREELSRDVACLIPGQHHRNAQGAEIDVELTVRLIDFNDRPADLTVAVDVSDRLKAERARRDTEEQLRQSQKMEALGQLTGGIAHDFNNVLMVIMDSVEELSERGSLDGEARRGLDRISDSTRRAEELTRQMLAFSRKQPLRPRPLSVNDLVADTGKLLRRTLGEQIEIDSILADDLWTVEIDPSQLEASLVYLCLNARDAMPNGGRVLIETSNVILDREKAPRQEWAWSGDFVLIMIADTGQGILPQHLDKIFEPFFTTKASGKSTGLGLSTVYGFVRQSNGFINVDSIVDKGTTFRIYLPRHSGAVAAQANPASAAIVGGNERLLVVEDDPQVRASVVRQLRSLGYAVAEAADGVAGLRAFAEADAPYELLLTDVIMPGGMNGKGLADEVTRRSPTTAIVFMSGYAANILPFDGDVKADVRLLSKPFRKSDLARMVRAALDGHTAKAGAS